MITTQKYGWIRSHPDIRDRDYRIHGRQLTIAPLPSSVDLRPGCPPVYNQGDYGCHDEKTEVLTERGWQAWPHYDGTSALGTMNPISGNLEFQIPTALQAYEYNGPLHLIQHKSLDFALTPNHRMYQRRWDARTRTLSPDFGFREIQDIGWYAGLPAATSGWLGVQLNSITIGRRKFSGDDFLSLIALVCSDGWVGGTESNWNRISYCCFRDDRIEMVRELSSRIGFGEVPGRPGVWLATDPELAEWFRVNIFTGSVFRSPRKRIPEIVKCADQSQIEMFLRFFGDQHIYREGGRAFYSSSRRMIDDLQELLLKIGSRSSIYEREPRSATMKDGRTIAAANCSPDITLNEWRFDNLSIERKRQMGTAEYKGAVFCATVPNSTLITRRNGSILISGNSCTANAIAAAIDFDRAKQGLPLIMPSRMFIYYNERVMEDSVKSDAGGEIRDGIKSVASLGACPESEWAYDGANLYSEPDASCYVDAKRDLVSVYNSLTQDLVSLKACLAAGFPFVFGITVYASFESDAVAKSGIVPMPEPNEGEVGGHAVLAVGYDDSTSRFLVRNSWGTGFGLDGYFTIPYDYLTNADLADDFWIINAVQVT